MVLSRCCPMGQPADLDGAEDGGQRAGVVGLDRAVTDTVGVDHLLDPLLA